MELTIVHTLHPDVLALLQGTLTGKTAVKEAPVKTLPAAGKTKTPVEDSDGEDAVTLEMIQAVLSEKKDAGKMPKIKALLAKWEVKGITALGIVDYPAFLKEAKAIK